jgi:glycosyltransferase involved in cell wall biosynthesis
MAECYLQAYPDALDASRIHIIPNGFEGTADSVKAPPRGKQCNILYTGTLSDYRFDTLLHAIRILKETFPDEAPPINFHFIGEGTELVGNQASALGLDDCVTIGGPVSQQDVTRLSREAHALLLLGRPPGMRGYELFAAAKLFGYLKSGRPILAVLPPDEAKKILQRVGVNTIANVDSISDIVELLRKLSLLWKENKLDSLIPSPNACEAFSARRQTEDLVRAFEGKSPSDPYVAGTADIPPSLREQVDLMRQTLSGRSFTFLQSGDRVTNKCNSQATVSTVRSGSNNP